MKNLLIPAALLVLFACKQPAAPTENHTPDPGTESVETKAPNTDYKPAFAGQTRIKKVSTTTPYEVTVLAEGIGKPWAIINLPDGRFLVTDKEGYMQIFSKDGKTITKVEGLPPVDSRGQGGLLDVALDPDFKTNRTLYWSFSEPQENKNLTAVAKGVLSADEIKVENPTVIFRALPYFDSRLHFGSRLIFDKEGNLFVSVGERSEIPGRVQAPILTSGLGKIFRITKEGKPAPGNPYLNTSNMPEIWASGIRNAQGLDIHPVTGELWENEFGPRGGDEINIIKPGKDYGWPIITYGIEYAGPKIGDGITQKEGLEQPVYYWDPVISPSGMAFYTGNQIPEWKNNLFIGALSGMHICRLIIENGKVTGEERLLEDKKERFRDVLNGKDGALYAVTDGGKIYRISKK